MSRCKSRCNVTILGCDVIPISGDVPSLPSSTAPAVESFPMSASFERGWQGGPSAARRTWRHLREKKSADMIEIAAMLSIMQMVGHPTVSGT